MKLTIGSLKEPIQVVVDQEYLKLQGAVEDLEDIVTTIEQSLSEYLIGTVEWSSLRDVDTASKNTPGIAKLGSEGDSDDIATLKYVKSRAGANGVPTSRKVNGYPLTSDIDLDNNDVNSMTEKEVDQYLAEEASKHSLVPTTRKVQGQPLTGNVEITPEMFGEEIVKKEARDMLIWNNNGTTVEPLRTAQFRLYGKKFVNGELTYTRDDMGVLGPEEFYQDEQDVYEYAKKIAGTNSTVGLGARFMFIGTVSGPDLNYREPPPKDTTVTANNFRDGYYRLGGGAKWGREIGYYVKARLGPEILLPASAGLASSNSEDYIRLVTRIDTLGNRYYRPIQFCIDSDGVETWQ